MQDKDRDLSGDRLFKSGEDCHNMAVRFTCCT